MIRCPVWSLPESLSQHFQLKADSYEIVEHRPGFLRARVVIAKPSVLPYLREDGEQIFEAKLPDEIFSTATIESAKGVPVTDGHPKINGQRVNVDTDNYRHFQRGALSDPRIETVEGERVLVADELVYDQSLIDSILSDEKREVSIGFETELDETPGEYNGRRYDIAQRKIRINHLAHVTAGRAGPSVSIQHLGDEADMKLTDDEKKPTQSYRLSDGRDIMVPDLVMSDLSALRKRADAADVVFASLKDKDAKKAASALKVIRQDSELDELIAELSGRSASMPDAEGEAQKQALLTQLQDANDKVKAWMDKYAQLEAEVPQMVEDGAKDMIATQDMAEKVIPEVKTDGLTAEEIKLQIIQKILPFSAGVDVKSISRERLADRYDAACELARTSVTARAEIRQDATDLTSRVATLKNSRESFWAEHNKRDKR